MNLIADIMHTALVVIASLFLCALVLWALWVTYKRMGE